MKIKTPLEMALANRKATVALSIINDLDRPFADRDAALKDYVTLFYAMHEAPFEACPRYVKNGRVVNCPASCSCNGINWVAR